MKPRRELTITLPVSYAPNLALPEILFRGAFVLILRLPVIAAAALAEAGEELIVDGL